MNSNRNKTLIAGASPNPGRYAFLAAQMLTEHGHEFVPVGIKQGSVLGKDILNLHGRPAVTGIDTVTMYVGPQNQAPWYDYILSLNPRRVIFNPGTENPEFYKQLAEKGIEFQEACTLVLLRTGQY